MALEEISFNNVNGDEINLTNLVSQMIDFYEQKREVGETELTDFNEGSEIRNLLEAFAILGYAIMEEQNESTKIAFIQTSYGDWLDRIGELPFIDLARVSGHEAQGSVTFTLSTVQEDDFVVPEETIVSCSDSGLEFVTLSDCLIVAGDLTGTVAVECMSVGRDGNVSAGEIDTVSDDGVDGDLVSVVNEYPMELGSDYEEDEEYRERLLANVSADGFGSIGYYRGLGESVDGVHDVKLIDDPSYTKRVLVNGLVKETPATVLLDVLAVFSDVHNLVLGHSFIVDKPVYDTVELEIGLSVGTEVDTDKLSDNLVAFFDGTGYDRMEYAGVRIDESVSRDKLVSVFSIFPDVVSVDSIVFDDEEVTELVPSVNGVLQLVDVSFNQTVVD